MELIFNPKNTHDEKDIHFVIITANYNKSDRWIFVKKKGSATWELPAGHKEVGESVLQAAKRELFEETGAKEYTMEVLTDYTLKTSNSVGVGRVFIAIVKSLGELPDSEIEKCLISNEFPLPHTYPKLQNKILEFAKNYLRRNNNEDK
jgi:8-oxo-dGTP diphosphatase